MKTTISCLLIICLQLLVPFAANSWGFFGHQKINYYAVFLLPPEMLVLYKPNIGFLEAHATDPDKRRYAVPDEGPRHYIDIDHYGHYPYDSLPRQWKAAVAKYSEDSLQKHGIVPWYVQTMLYKLTAAFKDKNFGKIMQYSAEIGHYIADAHVPLHANSNHNGQFSNQKGIHGFWESRIPELLADREWDFFIGHALYIKNPGDFIWKRVLESAAASDSVLSIEKKLSKQFRGDQQFAFEERNGLVIRQYSTQYSIAFDKQLNGMIERRMRQSIYAIASFWYTAWVNAGQPDLKSLAQLKMSEEDIAAFNQLNETWKTGKQMLGRQENE
ncbi:MAG: zinc dependent phospholipase C family protein [Chitinophagaceae bacterium]